MASYLFADQKLQGS